MSLCIFAAGKTVTLAVAAFTLSWTHSVEKTEWREDWQVRSAGLVMTGAMIKGSGAGVEPGPGARLVDGWWVWTPNLPPQRQLTLAASGVTTSAWRLCHGNGCIDLGGSPQPPVIVKPCD